MTTITKESRQGFRSWSHPNALAHPDSPAGGTGSGFARLPGPTTGDVFASGLPHPDSPAGRHYDWAAGLQRLKVESWIKELLGDIDRATSLTQLSQAAVILLGDRAFEVGVCYGMAESVVAMAGSLVELAKTFILAGLYDARTANGWAVGPFFALRVEAQVVEFLLGAGAFKVAHDRRDRLLRELAGVASHPADFLGAAVTGLGKEYALKWSKLKHFTARGTVSSSFEAGRIVGDVLVDLLSLITTVGDIARTVRSLGRVPELLRLSETLRTTASAVGAGSAKGDAAVIWATEATADETGPAIRSARAAVRESPSARAAEELFRYPALKGISQGQLDLAAAEGATEKQIAARKAVADAFYRDQLLKGVADKKEIREIKARIKSELKGIDYRKPVKARFSPPPEKMVQWQHKPGAQGNYYGDVKENATPSELGIGELSLDEGPPMGFMKKTRAPCTLQPGTPLLESTASNTNDIWSARPRSTPPGPFTFGDIAVQQTTGGATQYYIPKKTAVTF